MPARRMCLANTGLPAPSCKNGLLASAQKFFACAEKPRAALTVAWGAMKSKASGRKIPLEAALLCWHTWRQDSFTHACRQKGQSWQTSFQPNPQQAAAQEAWYSCIWLSYRILAC